MGDTSEVAALDPLRVHARNREHQGFSNAGAPGLFLIQGGLAAAAFLDVRIEIDNDVTFPLYVGFSDAPSVVQGAVAPGLSTSSVLKWSWTTGGNRCLLGYQA